MEYYTAHLCFIFTNQKEALCIIHQKPPTTSNGFVPQQANLNNAEVTCV